MGFPDSSVDKESACSAGDPSSIPGSGRSTGEGMGYPLLYSWASLAAQLVKNPPAMWETWVRSLSWEEPLKKGKTTHSSVLAGEFHGLYSPWGRKELGTTLWLSLSVHGGAGLECRSALCFSTAELRTSELSTISHYSSTSFLSVGFAPSLQKSSPGQQSHFSFKFMFSPNPSHWTYFSSHKSCCAHFFFPGIF